MTSPAFNFPHTDGFPAKKTNGIIRAFFYGTVWLTISLALFLIFSSLGIMGASSSRAEESAAGEEPVIIYPSAPMGAPYASSIVPVGSNAMLAIKSVGITSPIVFPDKTDYQTLRTALNQGVAHYPYAPLPDQEGNVFLFGHSSGRAYEANPARTVFTRLNKVQQGDIIEIWYKDTVYVYRTTLVRISPPENAVVYFQTPKKMLTLSTCWPIGDPKNRFVVEAEFVRSYPLRSISFAGTSS